MLVRSVAASAAAAALSPFGLRRRRGVAADASSSSAPFLFPVAVGLLVFLLLAQHVAAVADRKTRRKSASAATSSAPTAGDVISVDEGFVDGLNYTTPTVLQPQQQQQHLANSTTFLPTAAAAIRSRGSHDDRQFEFVNPKPADLKIECQPLKSKRYITDGFCTSIRPVVDFVCTGTCLPIRQLPWYAEFIKVWSHTKTLQYRCVDDVIRHRKVAFACDNGETRSYRIRVVRSCKCKRYVRSQNDSGGSGKGRKKKNKKLRNSAPPPPDDDFDDENEDDNFDDEDANW